MFYFLVITTMHPINQTLVHRSNNLIVKGTHYMAPTYDEDTYEQLPDLIDCFEFDFTVQVNGRMISFTESFTAVIENGDDGYPISCEVDNIMAWYLLARIMFSMGYNLTQYDGIVFADGDVLKEWITSTYRRAKAEE